MIFSILFIILISGAFVTVGYFFKRMLEVDHLTDYRMYQHWIYSFLVVVGIFTLYYLDFLNADFPGMRMVIHFLETTAIIQFIQMGTYMRLHLSEYTAKKAANAERVMMIRQAHRTSEVISRVAASIIPTIGMFSMYTPSGYELHSELARMFDTGWREANYYFGVIDPILCLVAFSVIPDKMPYRFFKYAMLCYAIGKSFVCWQLYVGFTADWPFVIAWVMAIIAIFLVPVGIFSHYLWKKRVG